MAGIITRCCLGIAVGSPLGAVLEDAQEFITRPLDLGVQDAPVNGFCSVNTLHDHLLHYSHCNRWLSDNWPGLVHDALDLLRSNGSRM